MNIAQIEQNLQTLMKSFTKETFIYDFLLAYGQPKASLTRLQKGSLNLSKEDGEVSWKKKVLFKVVSDQDLHVTVTSLAANIKHNQRFVIVTDFETLLAIDTKTQDKLDIPFADLTTHFDFFLPLAGMEKYQGKEENLADTKAAVGMARLFDEIRKDNPDNSPEFVHSLNVFLSRLLFCFFAEDTNIFEKGQFTNALSSHTQADGSDLHEYIDKLFEVLNTTEGDRKNLPAYLNAFPYVNGGLFRDSLPSPLFTRRSRDAIMGSGALSWRAINPDIFGSMMQAVITPEHRGGLGMHYTSVPNIMKVIEPLFLNDLYRAFESAKGNQKKLKELRQRLTRIKIFDPACGSGNFLIIAYKELKRLEMQILKEVRTLKGNISQANISFTSEDLSQITLDQFYGIEIDDFAHEIAQLSLWLAEHQMNVEFLQEFGQTNPTLPLKEAGHIVHGNACRVDWQVVCPKAKDSEIYVLGNPPYLGGKSQTKAQKEDMLISFDGLKKIGELDYISSWLINAAKFIEKGICCAFVTTTSICQGSQVQQLWPNIFKNNVELYFAYSAFKWTNNARDKAGVVVTIVGLRKVSNADKRIYAGDHTKSVTNISPYLIEASNLIIYQRLRTISTLPTMLTGNSPYDGGHLLLSEKDVLELQSSHPKSGKFIRRIYGSQDYLNSHDRWCLWIKDEDSKEAMEIDFIKDRIAKTKEFRRNGGEVAIGLVNKPYQFRYTHEAKNNLIIIPRVSSERRKYIPFGFLDREFIVSDSAQAIYDPEPYILGVLLSNMHQVWVKITGGYLGTSIRYSSALCYNTFPFPSISDQRKQEITQCVFRILDEREKHSEKTLAQLYDPDKMPKGLKEAHKANDEVIERCYRTKPFESDEERLEYMFKLYEKMIAEEQDKNTLFQKEKKRSVKKK